MVIALSQLPNELATGAAGFLDGSMTQCHSNTNEEVTHRAQVMHKESGTEQRSEVTLPIVLDGCGKLKPIQSKRITAFTPFW